MVQVAALDGDTPRSGKISRDTWSGSRRFFRDLDIGRDVLGDYVAKGVAKREGLKLAA
ncbi:hypothetical protein KCP91_16275 [Microvirga sp. SRT01]|uniref:Uncharacterized protein n=1 Tax=Sphingomonas longa TaxID=2778730 RepID=A0ABS2DAH9_9SPHN|nr:MULTISPECIES: hypothetical protein [Alphaproteobacteria]MBM6577942.1 hypothetical protein [Sphingomonas sp. BT552]MBR7710983.1 hypothetical protein [Microvirga sp. SRT01]